MLKLLFSALVTLSVHASLNPADRYTDDDLMRLAEKTASKDLRPAILNPKLPEEGRPQAFFDALAGHFDPNKDGRLTLKELESAINQHADRYQQLLEESLVAEGPQTALTKDFRVKTWKMLQKLVLLKGEMKARGLSSWKVPRQVAFSRDAAWDRDHTITSRKDFMEKVCAASQTRPVLVKFGQTQCADCLLMEFNQGVRATAKSAPSIEVQKFWWGPYTSDEMDEIRRQEGVKTSPTFVIYSKGRRTSCGYAFATGDGRGLESCLKSPTEGGTGSEACAVNKGQLE